MPRAARGRGRRPLHLLRRCRRCNGSAGSAARSAKALPFPTDAARSAAASSPCAKTTGRCCADKAALDAVRMAFEIELGGRAFYQRAAADSSDDELRALFGRFAVMEGEHMETLSRRYHVEAPDAVAGVPGRAGGDLRRRRPPAAGSGQPVPHRDRAGKEGRELSSRRAPRAPPRVRPSSACTSSSAPRSGRMQPAGHRIRALARAQAGPVHRRSASAAGSGQPVQHRDRAGAARRRILREPRAGGARRLGRAARCTANWPPRSASMPTLLATEYPRWRARKPGLFTGDPLVHAARAARAGARRADQRGGAAARRSTIPARIALVCGDQQLTYGELRDRVARAAGGLARARPAAGRPRGDQAARRHRLGGGLPRHDLGRRRRGGGQSADSGAGMAATSWTRPAST